MAKFFEKKQIQVIAALAENPSISARAYRDARWNRLGEQMWIMRRSQKFTAMKSGSRHRYSPPELIGNEKTIIQGMPDYELISTSYIERLNATTRLHMRRLTRLTLALSKKLDNLKAAMGLHFVYYKFVRRHNTLRCTPAMAAGVEKTFWTVAELVEAAS
jgi:hypothetical protein